MDEKDRVLKTLLDEDKKQGNFFSLHFTLEKAHPDLDRADILQILEKFEAKRLISLSAKRIKGTPFVRVNSAAYSYYNNREQRQAAEEAARAEAEAQALAEIEEWEERSWNYKMIAFGFVGGLLTGIALMWLKGKFFV
jgi:hypothetical protein